MGKALALGLLLVVAATGGDASGAKRKPRPVRILEPGALTFDYRGGLLVADRKLHRVVRLNLRTGKRRVVVTGLRDIVGLAIDDQRRLYVAAGDRIYRLAGGTKNVIAGTGQRGHTGDGGPATAASFGGIGGFEVDHDKSVVVAEYDNWIRFIDPNGSVSTIAGNGEEGYAGDGGPARVAVLRHPHDLALRVDRELIVADSHNGVLRRIDPSGTITTFATGFVAPIAVKGGAGNSLYVADGGQNAVFRLSSDGQTRRRIVRASGPINLAVDDKDNVYVSEIAGARRVLRVSRSGRVRVLVR